MLPVSQGCDRSDGDGSGASSTRPAPKRPTVASLSPAATDILVAIGAAEHLVAVSNYDMGKPSVAGLPGAGDYLTVDWERLASLRPNVLVVQVREASAPAGFKQNAAALNIRPVYVHIDKLADISAATVMLGEAVNEPAKAAAAERAMRETLDAVEKSVAGRTRVRTLVVTDEVGAGVAGSGTFLDEILTIAGGANAAAGEGSGYPGVDREKIAALAPEVVLHLQPDKPARVVEEAKRFWASMPNVPAVRNERVHFLTDRSVMHPGLGVGKVAELFADKIHPDRTSSRPSTPTAHARPHAGAERASGSKTAPPRTSVNESERLEIRGGGPLVTSRRSAPAWGDVRPARRSCANGVRVRGAS
jgi:iron complex transport system substrate-binding protein